MGPVADAHRARVAVAREVGQLELGEVAGAVEAVDDLELRVGGIGLAAALLEPVVEGDGLVVEAQALEGEGGEGRVAQPGVAVVPVAPAADRLRQARGGRGDHGPGRRVGAELERDGRALDHLAPAPVVAHAGHPAAPVAVGLLQAARDGVVRPALPAAARLQDEPGPLAGRQGEARRSGAVVGGHGQARGELGGRAVRRREAREVGAGQLEAVVQAGVAEGRPAPHAEVDGAAHHVDAAHQRAGLELQRHEVGDLGDAAAAEEARHKGGGVRQVELLAGARDRGRDAEAAADVGVEDRREEAGPVEAPGAEPVDRPVEADEGRRPQVADQPVALDGAVAGLVAAPAGLVDRDDGLGAHRATVTAAAFRRSS